MRKLWIVAASVLFPTTAWAHPGAHGYDLAYGFAHPMGGLDHLVAMVAVGVLAGILGGRALWQLPLSFMAMMVVGFVLGANHLGLPQVEAGIALSIVAIGGAIAVARPGSWPLAIGLVGVSALFHGYAHGLEVPADAGALPFGGGFIAATALLYAVGLGTILALLRLGAGRGVSTVRAAGGIVALGGVGLLLGWL